MAGLNDAIRLLELTCARLCHELSGLAGTLAGVIDLAAEEAPAAAESLSVGHDAAAELTQRLRMLRAAWGPADAPLPVGELVRLAEGRPNARRVAISTGGLAADTVLAPATGRLALNVLLLAAESLPAGGTINLTGTADDLFCAIAGTGAAWPSGLAGCLADPAEAFAALGSARAVQMPLTALLAHAYGPRLSLLMAPGGGSPAAPLRIGGA